MPRVRSTEIIVSSELTFFFPFFLSFFLFFFSFSMHRLLVPSINLIHSCLKKLYMRRIRAWTFYQLLHLYIIITYLSWQCIYICYTISSLLNDILTSVKRNFEYDKSVTRVLAILTILPRIYARDRRDLTRLNIRISIVYVRALDWAYEQRRFFSLLELEIHIILFYFRIKGSREWRASRFDNDGGGEREDLAPLRSITRVFNTLEQSAHDYLKFRVLITSHAATKFNTNK